MEATEWHPTISSIIQLGENVILNEVSSPIFSGSQGLVTFCNEVVVDRLVKYITKSRALCATDNRLPKDRITLPPLAR